MTLWRTGRTLALRDGGDDDALQEVVDGMDKSVSYGTAAPDSNTPGDIYFKKGAAAGNAATVYIRDKTTNTWWGG